VAEGATNKNQRVKHEKSVLHARVPPGQAPQAASPRACRRFHHLYASGRSLSFSSSRDIAPPERATPPTNRLLQRLRASCLPRAFAAFDPGHGSCGGALAEGFGESATLALNHPTSNEPITTDSVEPIIRHRPFVRLTSFGGEGRALDRQIATMSSASKTSRLRPEGVGRAL
jgi:hypothetical protein